MVENNQNNNLSNEVIEELERRVRDLEVGSTIRRQAFTWVLAYFAIITAVFLAIVGILYAFFKDQLGAKASEIVEAAIAPQITEIYAIATAVSEKHDEIVKTSEPIADPAEKRFAIIIRTEPIENENPYAPKYLQDSQDKLQKAEINTTIYKLTYDENIVLTLGAYETEPDAKNDYEMVAEYSKMALNLEDSNIDIVMFMDDLYNLDLYDDCPYMYKVTEDHYKCCLKYPL